MHVTRRSSYAGHEIPVIVRGEGAYVHGTARHGTAWHGTRYLDDLSGPFVVRVGHGRTELAAGAEQAAELAYFPL